jgi:5-methyltetrahydropteroyltriglutamate--homocysteine methyltransferase
MFIKTATLGFPRMGPNRELKFALEKHWKGKIDQAELLQVAQTVEELGWKVQKDSGAERITVGDHYLYDDTSLSGLAPWNIPPTVPCHDGTRRNLASFCHGPWR